MDDVALYTAYYSHYHARAAEVAAVPSVSRKSQGLICAFLAFGSLCGMATVAVGFVAHNPAIIWPVVAVGLVGVIAGLVLAHRKATGGWVWGPPPARAQAPSQPSGNGQAAAAASSVAAGGRPGGFQLPMYCADAYDVEMGFTCSPSPPSTAADKTEKLGAASSGDTASCSGASGGSITEDSSTEPMPASPAAAAGQTATAGPAAAAAEYGAVMCGLPLPGADGWIDTRPVLVLQPHPHMVLLPDPLLPTSPCAVAGSESAPVPPSALTGSPQQQPSGAEGNVGGPPLHSHAHAHSHACSQA